MTKPRETFVVTLTPLPGDNRPGIQRLRTLLKFALRGLRLKCVALSGTDETKPIEEPAA